MRARDHDGAGRDPGALAVRAHDQVRQAGRQAGRALTVRGGALSVEVGENDKRRIHEAFIRGLLAGAHEAGKRAAEAQITPERRPGRLAAARNRLAAAWGLRRESRGAK